VARSSKLIPEVAKPPACRPLVILAVSILALDCPTFAPPYHPNVSATADELANAASIAKLSVPDVLANFLFADFMFFSKNN
jgi:hypothetical protein